MVPTLLVLVAAVLCEAMLSLFGSFCGSRPRTGVIDLVPEPATESRADGFALTCDGRAEVRFEVVEDGARLDLGLVDPGIGPRDVGGVLVRDEEELLVAASCLVGLVSADCLS